MYKKLLVIVAAVTLIVGCSGTPEPVKKATDDLTLHYIKNHIFNPVNSVDCRAKMIDNDYYVFCNAAGSDIGGLYLIKYDNEGNYKIFTVNGKASQYAKGLLTYRLKEFKDISEIIKRFQ